MDMPIAAWLKHKRLEAGLDLRQLAAIAGTNQGQISRVETGKSELSLNSLVLLVWALKIDPAELISEFSYPPLLSRVASFEQLLLSYQGCVDIRTVLAFANNSENRLPGAIRFIERHLRKAVNKAQTPILPAEGLLERVQEAVLQGVLLPNPPALTLRQVLIYYSNNAVITMADAGTCLRLHRHKKNWGLEELAKASSVNKSTINRLENNQSDRISLTAAVNLDQALDAGGQVFSMFWAAAQLQMGVVVATDEINSARYYWSEKTQHLIDTFLKLARWSHLYDDPELPWLTATPGKEEILEFIETFKTKQKVGDVDVPTFVRKIEMLIPGNFSLMGEEEAKTSPEADIQRGLTVWTKIKNHVGDDPFGIRILKLYSQNFLEFDYISAFRVLLRELLMNDHSFFNEMKEMVDEENEKNVTKRKDD